MPQPTESTESAKPAETTEIVESPEVSTDTPRGTDRRAIAIAAALLLACGGLIGYGILDTPDKPKPRAVPTAEVTYEVTGKGTAEISYLARSEVGNATVVSDVALPWKKSVQVPLGKAPVVNITLNEQGGQASCTLAIRGKHVQRATVMGEYGRATCTSELPAADGSTG
ncbi:MmpS family transport accessory protein [Streptomyces sp. NPDC001832]|uniref:MmpS family transport accessory protein n=1 Tax=Streptomyces sp. NPDC001832 TaxID=3154527 RepID=UPI00332879DC